MSTKKLKHKKKRLLPCPFCGIEARIVRRYYMAANRMNLPHEKVRKSLDWIGCWNSGCAVQPRIPGNKEEIIKSWNKRVA